MFTDQDRPRAYEISNRTLNVTMKLRGEREVRREQMAQQAEPENDEAPQRHETFSARAHGLSRSSGSKWNSNGVILALQARLQCMMRPLPPMQGGGGLLRHYCICVLLHMLRRALIGGPSTGSLFHSHESSSLHRRNPTPPCMLSLGMCSQNRTVLL
jgi:hypothetical protein